MHTLYDSESFSVTHMLANAVVIGSEPEGDHAATEAGVDTYRAALKTGMRFNNQEARVTVMDRKELTPLTGMVAAGDFVDSTHLTYAGYVRTEQECWKPLLGSSWRQGRARSRVVGGSR